VTRLTLRIGVVVAGLVALSTTAQGQRRVRGGRAVLVDRPAVGPRVGYDFDADHVFVGGQLNLPVGRFAYRHASGAGDAGANLFAGWEGRRARPFKPFLEAKFVFADNSSFNVEAGLNFPL